MAPSGKRILLIHNAQAGRRSARRVADLCRHLEGAGHHLTLVGTRQTGDAGKACLEADLSGVDLLLVAGGDGTINDAVNGLLGREDDPNVPLGILPVGTANVLAWEIGLGTSEAEILRYVGDGEVAEILPGLAGGHAFMTMTSAGFDSWVVDTVDIRLKRVIGKGAYGARAIRGLVSWPRPQITVRCEGRNLQAGSVVVSRGRYYGGRFVLAPEADIRRASLTVCVMHDTRPAALFRAGADFLRDRLGESGNIERFETQRVVLEGADLPVQADGDSIARLPVEIGLSPRPVRLLFPPA